MMNEKIVFPIGVRCTNVRWMTKDEAESEGWDFGWESCPVLEFEDGSVVYPSQDPEGNGPGMLFGKLPDNTQVYVYPPQG